MNRTPIEWALNPDGTPGFTCSPKTGCYQRCPYCYAETLANGRCRARYLAGTNIVMENNLKAWQTALQDPFAARWWPHKLEQIRKRRKPAGIFLDDMSDWAGPYWPEAYTQAEMDTIRACPQHRFYLLTKQPQELQKWSPFPANAWVGVSATGEVDYLAAARYLRDVQASVKFISFEPLLEDVDNGIGGLMEWAGIGWVIIGAQTKPTVNPEIAWVENIVTGADAAGIPVFLKDSLWKPLFECPPEAHDLYWEDIANLRREMPA